MENSSVAPLSSKRAILTKVAIALFSMWLLTYLFIWILSPVLVRHFAAEPLQNMQVSLADSSSVRFNPFTSTLSIKQLVLLDRDQQSALTLNNAEISIHLHRLLISQVYVSFFSVEGLNIEVLKEGESIIVAGINMATQPQVEAPDANQTAEPKTPSNYELILPWMLLEKVSANITLDGISQGIRLNSLAVNDSTLSQTKQNLNLSVDASLNNAQLLFTTKLVLTEQEGEINNQISLTNFPLASISPLLKAQNIDISGALSVNASPVIVLSKSQIKIFNDTLTLGLDDLSLDIAPWLVSGVQQNITLKDLRATASLEGILQDASLSIHTDLQQGNVSLTTANNSLAYWQKIDINTNVSMVADQTSIDLPSLSISGLKLSQNLSMSEPLPMLALSNLSVTNLTFEKNTLAIEDILLSGLNANITLDEDKTLAGLIDTSALSGNTVTNSDSSENAETTTIPTNAVSPASQQAPLLIKLNNLQLADTGLVKVVDMSVKPAFSQQLRIEKLRAGPFNNRQTDSVSPFEVIIIDDNYLKIDLAGQISPFAEKLNTTMTANVTELNLPSVSPYVKGGLGFELKSGQLDITLQVNIEEDEIDGNTRLFLRGVEMSSADEVEQSMFKEGKAMPLNAALDVLKDDDGNIDLNVPMRGDIASPSFGFESFLSIILKKAAMSQAKDYLMTTFVPYASVVSVALSGAEYLLRVSLEPLTFDVAQAELKLENQAFLSELTLLMKDKPTLQIKTCAIVTYADLALSQVTKLTDDQKAQIKMLGDARQANLKRFLVEQGITSSRILYCAPEIDKDLAAEPRIELKTD